LIHDFLRAAFRREYSRAATLCILSRNRASIRARVAVTRACEMAHHGFMTKEHRLYLAAFFMIAVLPIFLLIKVVGHQIRTAALMNRQPTADTKLLRNALKDCNGFAFTISA
jgi:hypothetical protein